MKLHEAILKILEEENGTLSPVQIAERVNKRKLYTRRDRNPVPSSQISARVNNYPHFFRKKEDGGIEISGTFLTLDKPYSKSIHLQDQFYEEHFYTWIVDNYFYLDMVGVDEPLLIVLSTLLF